MSQDQSGISRVVERLKKEGSFLAEPVPVGGMPPMTFDCSFAPDGAGPEELSALPGACPPHLLEFWSIARTATLFEDTEYGQWGLELLSPQQAIEATES